MRLFGSALQGIFHWEAPNSACLFDNNTETEVQLRAPDVIQEIRFF